MLDIVTDFSGAENADVKVEVWHYGILESEPLQMYIIVQILVLSCILIMALDVINAIIKLVGDWRHRGFNAAHLIEPIVDFCSGTLAVVYVVLALQQKIASADVTGKILGKFSAIPWSDPEIELSEKTSTFFEATEELMRLIGRESFNNMLCYVLLLVTLFRVRS